MKQKLNAQLKKHGELFFSILVQNDKLWVKLTVKEPIQDKHPKNEKQEHFLFTGGEEC